MDADLDRAAVKLLMQLSRRNARLVPADNNGHSGRQAPGFGIVRGQPDIPAKRVHVPQELVKRLHTRQLIVPNKGGFVLSQTGQAFLRRLMSHGDPFREQHQDRAMEMAEIEGSRRPVLVNETESPLGWLRRRKDKNGAPLIDAAQFEAGERLRADYFFAGLSPRVTASWDGIPGDKASRRAAPGTAANLREQTVAAQQRVRRALEAVGPDLGGILVDVCCHLQGLEDAEKAKGWPRRSAKLVLQIALKELARHYGLVRSAAEAAHDTSRQLMHWGAPDYKPQTPQG